MQTISATGNARGYATAVAAAGSRMKSFKLRELESAALHARTAVKLASPAQAGEADEILYKADLALAIHKMVHML